MSTKFCTSCNMYYGRKRMLFRLPQKRINSILDRFHRGAVNVLLGATVFLTCFVSYQIYDLMNNIAPKILSEQKKYEDEFLREISEENGESDSLVQSD
ncbi:hypothetical protein T03_131 [Trichinella britovi]|uniref:Uncharacterized protein n=2 Tax=Trichinella TaxID=6333 RepID=A0A0V1DF11_TRIBR|nr:hypothetical protein T05_10597 [Trichinella murrelli]KRY60063.1 hypothetical protein T03_131 [Trichinella britovi]